MQHISYHSREFHEITSRDMRLVYDDEDDDPAPFASARGSMPPPRTRERPGALHASNDAIAMAQESMRAYPVPIPVRPPPAYITRALRDDLV